LDVRAAAKNFPHVIVVIDPQDYKTVADKIKAGGISISIISPLPPFPLPLTHDLEDSLSEFGKTSPPLPMTSKIRG
jgi:hypothetical protein